MSHPALSAWFQPNMQSAISGSGCSTGKETLRHFHPASTAVIRREDGIGFATLTGTEAQLLAACYQNLTLGEIPQDWLSALGPLVEKQLLCSFRLDAE